MDQDWIEKMGPYILGLTLAGFAVVWTAKRLNMAYPLRTCYKARVPGVRPPHPWPCRRITLHGEA